MQISLFNLILIYKLVIWFNLKHDSIWFYIDYIWICVIQEQYVSFVKGKNIS